MNMNEILILSTTDSLELAEKIAECLLLIKSTSEKFDAIRARIHQLHSYQVPEIIAVPVSAGDPAYLAWLREGVAGQRIKGLKGKREYSD
jgi:uncharacterized protein involved in tolerance to divalent cations